MRKLFFIISLFFAVSLTAQNKADDIVGYFLSTDPFTKELSQNYIYRAADGTFEAKVVWVQNPKLKHHEGLVFMKNLVFNPKKNEWENGKMIYPGKKGNYRADMSITSDNKLKVRGYWGVELFGKTLYWTREKEARK